MKNYYDLLTVTRDAPADDIKKAFRREIARYHPDKVQHLGTEFQEMAAGIAADLTEAYRILMDPALRARYDADLSGPGAQAPRPQPAAASPAPPPAAPFGAPEPAAPPTTRSSAGTDFVRRAALSRIKDAVADVFATSEPLAAPGFDVAIATHPKKSLFRKADDSLRLLVKFVAFVDGRALDETWLPAARIGAGSAGCTLLLVGQGLAPAKELAAAVTELRRKSRGGGPLVVPVDVRDWEALFPPETPGSVRSLIQRLKEEKR